MTDATDAAVLREALAARDSMEAKRNALQIALAESASTMHRAMKHVGSDWRGRCDEPECRAAWLALSAHGGK